MILSKSDAALTLQRSLAAHILIERNQNGNVKLRWGNDPADSDIEERHG